MTIDDLARRLSAVASEVSQVKAELARDALIPDRAGSGAAELAGLLESVWVEHMRRAEHLAAGLDELSAAVAAAADGYRATDGERF